MGAAASRSARSGWCLGMSGERHPFPLDLAGAGMCRSWWGLLTGVTMFGRVVAHARVEATMTHNPHRKETGMTKIALAAILLALVAFPCWGDLPPPDGALETSAAWEAVQPLATHESTLQIQKTGLSPESVPAAMNSAQHMTRGDSMQSSRILLYRQGSLRPEAAFLRHGIERRWWRLGDYPAGRARR